MDTPVSSSLRLFAEGSGEKQAEQSDAGMAPKSLIENFDVFLDPSLFLCMDDIAAMMDEFIFQCAPEASMGALSQQFPRRDIDGRIPNCATSAW